MRVYIFEGNDRLKIGYSKHPELRLEQIQPNVADEIRLAYQTEEIPNYRLIERLVHKLLKPYRTKGEWFRLSLQDGIVAINKAIDIANKQLEDDYLKTKSYKYNRVNVSLTGNSVVMLKELRKHYEKDGNIRMSLTDVVSIALKRLEAELAK